jgi:hypothetical protein
VVPDPAFHSDADADPASQNDADPDPQQWKWAYCTVLKTLASSTFMCFLLGKASNVSVKRAGQVTGVTSNRKEKYPGKPYKILQ